MPVAFLLGEVSHLMPIAELDRQSSKLLDHTHLSSIAARRVLMAKHIL